nr:ribonuclease H-like domain-containing protein [Tanacetum cinerariifolium]
MMGISNEYQLKFNSIKDAKKLLEAVEKRFGGNPTTKKTQKNLLKQQYENFTAPQRCLIKLLIGFKSLNKADLDTMSMDDLYNNLKVYELEVKGISSSSSSTQNMAFVSSSNNNTSSSNRAVNTAQAINTAHGVYIASTQVNAAYSTNIDNLSNAVICSFFSSQQNSPQLVHEDLEQIHPDDMEEMDLRWQMAMLTMRARSFLKKTRWKLTVNGNETIGFDKSNVECYNCHMRRHFDRECKTLRNQDNLNKEILRRSVPVETSTTISLVSCDSLGGYDWSDQVEERPNYALVAFASSSSVSEVSDNEDEDVSQPKIEKKIVRLSIAKIEFVKSKQQEKTARKTVKQVEQHKQNTHNPRVLISTARQVNAAHSKTTVNAARPMSHLSKIAHSTIKRLGHLNFKTMNKLVKGNLVRGLPSKLFENDQTCVACQKKKHHRASCKPKTENSISLPLHLLHMDLFGPTFVKSLKKKMYCLVVIDGYSRFTWVFFLATEDETSGILKSFSTGIENLVDYKADEGFFVGYSLNSKAFRVFNSRTRLMEQNLRIRFSESTPNVLGRGPAWLFDIDALTRTMNYEPIVAEIQEKNECNDQEKEDNVNSTNNVNTVSSTVNTANTNRINAVGKNISIELQFDLNMPALEDVSTFDFSKDNKDDGAVAHMNNLDTTIQVSPIPTTKIHKYHPLDQVIGDLQSATQTRKMSKNLEKHGFTEVKTASTSMETQKPLLKDEDGEEVDVHMYRSMIGSLMYLTSSRPDIMFVVCACARYQVNLKSTAMAKTINGKAQSHAKVNGKKIIATESSVKRDIRLADEEDEAFHKELGDRLVRAATTASRLEAKQNSEITLAEARGALKTLKPRRKGLFFMIQEERLKRERSQKEQEANIALIETWDNFQAKIDADHQLAERLQAQEQEELVNTSEDFRPELVERKEKRVGEEPIQESTQKQKVEDDKEKAELKQLMEAILDEEEVAIDAILLDVKSLKIVDWKIHKEGKKSYYQIVKADGKSQMYMFFS